MNVLLLALSTEQLNGEHLSRVRSLAHGYEVVATRDEGIIRSRLDDIEIAAGMFPFSLLAEAKNLRWFQQFGAGADWLMERPEIASLDIAITNASGVHSIPITEHIMAYLLCFARGFKASILGQGGHVWEDSRRQPLFELDGKRVLLVGVGAIGAQFAKAASAFGMHVVGVRRSGGQPLEGTVKVVGASEIDAELPEADFVVLTVPLTNATRHMIDARRIGLLKPSAYLINIGRGATVDEQALIDALASKRIAGAGLDVFETEPLPDDSPLWDLENVILTPHYAGITPRYVDRLMEIFTDNLTRYVEGRPLRNLVDVKQGY